MTCWKLVWACLSATLTCVTPRHMFDILLDQYSCIYETYPLEENKGYIVKWDGRSLPEECRQGFSVPDNNYYKILVTTDKYDVQDSNFTLLYIYDRTIRQIFNCTSTPTSLEIEDTKRILLDFSTSGNSSSSNIQIRIYTEKSVGFLQLLVLVVIAILISAFCVWIKKKGIDLQEIGREIRDSFVKHFCRCCHGNQTDTGNQTQRPIQAQTQNEPPDPTNNQTSLLAETGSGPLSPTPYAPPYSQTTQDLADFEQPPPSYEDCIREDLPPPYPGKMD